MKSTGIVRKIDELGRIVLPIEIRNRMDLQTRDAVEIYVEADKIILRKYQPACLFCSGTEDLRSFQNRLICAACLKKLKSTL